jgi:hypothetical protein
MIVVTNVVYPTNSCTVNDQAGPWRARARELAAWAWRLLVNRQDVWGGYYLDYDSSGGRHLRKTTRPAKPRRGWVRLTEIILLYHFLGHRVEDLIGLHTTSTSNTSRWGACELDYHGPGGNSPRANLAAVVAWYTRLTRLGFHPLLTTSDGRGGFHLRLLLAGPAPTAQVFDFLRDSTADYRRHGLTAPPECFPKQRQIDSGKYGNWLRLPGRHHTEPHWSLVYDGRSWLEGEAAVSFILGLTGDDPALLPPERPEPPRRPRSDTGSGRLPEGVVLGNLADQIARYERSLPRLGEGQGRDDVGYRFACYLVRDVAVSDEVARAWLKLWDDKNTPPKGSAAIDKWISSAHLYGRNEYGCALPIYRTGDHVTIITTSEEVY